MKTFFLFTFLLCGISAKQFPEDAFNIWVKLISPYEKECAGGAGISPEYGSKMVLIANIPNEPKYLKYVVCLYEQLDFFQADGEFSVEEIMAKAPYMTNGLTTKCVNLPRGVEDRLEKSYIFGSCVVDGLSE